jgi:methyl coenzyme M reductase subunit C
VPQIERKQEVGLLRRKAYPDDKEQIGALVKAVKALAAGQPIPEDAMEIIQQVDVVKQTYPKKTPA